MSDAGIIWLLLMVALSVHLPNLAVAQEVPEGFEARKNLWQEELESRPFVFVKDEPGLISSLEHYSASCQLNIVVDPLQKNEQQNYRMSLKFVRQGKEVLTLPGGRV